MKTKINEVTKEERAVIIGHYLMGAPNLTISALVDVSLWIVEEVIFQYRKSKPKDDV